MLLLVLTNTASAEEAQAIASAAVTQGLATAAQVVGPVQSTFVWQGQMQTKPEWICLLKTSQACYPALEQLIGSLHSYQRPAILALPVALGEAAYLAWWNAALREP